MTSDNDQDCPAAARPEGALWYEDPLEVDRFLDGEVDADTATRRSADLDANTTAAALVAARKSFLAGLAEAGAAYRGALPEQVPGDLGLRVRAALASGTPGTSRTSSRGVRWLTAVAALALLALGASLWSRGDQEATAMPPAVLTAAELARMSAEAGTLLQGGCEDLSEFAPRHFPPFSEGGLQFLRCEKRGEEMVARLARPEDLPSVGYVAVAESGRPTGPTIGMTDLGDLVVYDLAYGKKHHYLAVGRAFLDRERAKTPGRESCRACHNRSREGQANPHNIVARSWR